jgi:putative phosphoesterase
MKLAILSDTHGNYPLAVKALELTDRLDYVIHLGDTADDAEIIEMTIGCEVIKLSGNCDATKKYPELITTTISNRKFLLTHGDQFSVKNGLGLLQQRAQEDGADVILYGHTHIPSIMKIDGMLFINPGSLKQTSSTKNFAILSIENDGITAEIFDAKQASFLHR